MMVFLFVRLPRNASAMTYSVSRGDVRQILFGTVVSSLADGLFACGQARLFEVHVLADWLAH